MFPSRALPVALIFLVAFIPSTPADEEGGSPGKPNLDVRWPGDEKARASFVLRPPSLARRIPAETLKHEIPAARLRWDGLSGSPKWIAAPPGSALSAPKSGAPEDVARAFLHSRKALFGLHPAEVGQLRVTSVVRAPDGGAHVYFTQTMGGLEVYGGRANVNLNPDGSVRSVGSQLFSGVERPAVVSVSPADAVSRAARDVYPLISLNDAIVSMEEDGERRTVFDGTGFGRSPEARLVLFPEADLARLAWEVRVAEPGLQTDYRILIDAVDGRILTRHNMTLYATARVIQAAYPDPEHEEYAPPQHQIATVPVSTPESPAGWLAGDETVLEGNNATTHLGYWTEPPLSDPTASYDYPFNTPESMLVNAWYWANDAHDRFYALGFDEAAGNFQTDNFRPGRRGR